MNVFVNPIDATASAALVPTTEAEAICRLRAYLEAEADDLIKCCTWLGGEHWAKRADSFVMAALKGGTFGRWPRSLLAALHSLLSLELIDDAESTEAGRFVCLDLEDPRVERCCWHADTLGAVLAVLRAEDLATRGDRIQACVPPAA